AAVDAQRVNLAAFTYRTERIAERLPFVAVVGEHFPLWIRGVELAGMDSQGMGPAIELTTYTPMTISFVDVAMTRNRADIESADVQLALERRQAVEAMVGPWLAKVLPVRAALVAIDAAEVHALGLRPVASRGRGIQRVVMHDECVDPARPPSAN